MAIKGMNTDQVRGFGNSLQNQTLDQFQSMMNSINQQVQNLDWRGSDADQFKGTEMQRVQQLFTTFRNGLQEMAHTAVKNAEAQDATTGQY